MPLAGAAVTALSAQITVPIEPVPFTLQTFVVMLVGLSMGAKRAAASQVIYLGAGAAGLPVFANHLGGPAVLLGTTGGYLISFVLVAAWLGWCADRGFDKRMFTCGLALVVGILINLGLGAFWLSAYIGVPAAFLGGFVPFLGVECLKAVVAATMFPGVRRVV